MKTQHTRNQTARTHQFGLHEIELIEERPWRDTLRITERMCVPGGWIYYRTIIHRDYTMSTDSDFVPDVAKKERGLS
jgi:hypothetical protein